jgi:hypothetical protein
MRVEIASSCKLLKARVIVGQIETNWIQTHSWLFPFPLLSDNTRPAVIVIFSEADQLTDGASVRVLGGSKLTFISLVERDLRRRCGRNG